jgi:hypothetical protein
MKVLFDHTIIQDSIRGDHEFQCESHQPGRNNYAKFVDKMRPRRNDWTQNEIDCLPAIAKFAHEGIIKAFRTGELMAEDRVGKFPSSYIDLFAGVKFEKALAPLERSKWGLSIEQYHDKEQVITYCLSFFLTPSQERIERFISEMRANPRFSLSTFEEKCLRRAQVFKDMCYGIDKKHYPDALHLWTAEENNLDVFLTIEKRFRNVMHRQKIKLNCRIMFPSELVFSLTGR